MGAPVVLVVEDDDSIREVLVELLSTAGYGVVGVHDGIEALAYLDGAADMPGIAIVDVMMPAMDGLTFASAVRDRASRLPIIVLSASEQDVVVGGPIVAFMRKPVRWDELLAAVAAVVAPSR
jgi:DNA-binding response OmpR family regulator